MIKITEWAKQELKYLLSQKLYWPEARLRLIDRGQGMSGKNTSVYWLKEIVFTQGLKIKNLKNL